MRDDDNGPDIASDSTLYALKYGPGGVVEPGNPSCTVGLLKLTLDLTAFARNKPIVSLTEKADDVDPATIGPILFEHAFGLFMGLLLLFFRCWVIFVGEGLVGFVFIDLRCVFFFPIVRLIL